jgi:hypothetical protein
MLSWRDFVERSILFGRRWRVETRGQPFFSLLAYCPAAAVLAAYAYMGYRLIVVYYLVSRNKTHTYSKAKFDRINRVTKI